MILTLNASNSIFAGACPRPRWGAQNAPLTPLWWGGEWLPLALPLCGAHNVVKRSTTFLLHWTSKCTCKCVRIRGARAARILCL